MVSLVGVLSGATLTLLVVVLHYAKGTGWEPSEDISQQVLEQRAATLPETDFAEPYNRSIGGGATAAIPEGAADGELGDSEETAEDDSFDPADIADDEIEYYEIEFSKEGETIEVANNETLLDAGEEEGWDLPYACREGQCISCAGKIADGSAEEYIRHSNNDSLMDDDMDDGYCLTCVAYPTGDFTLETGESP
jgi:2Fe-2S type ferredoxin